MIRSNTVSQIGQEGIQENNAISMTRLLFSCLVFQSKRFGMAMTHSG